MSVLECPNCSVLLKREIRKKYVTPPKTYIALICPDCHRVQEIDITDNVAGLQPEEVDAFARKVIQELEGEEEDILELYDIESAEDMLLAGKGASLSIITMSLKVIQEQGGISPEMFERIKNLMDTFALSWNDVVDEAKETIDMMVTFLKQKEQKVYPQMVRN